MQTRILRCFLLFLLFVISLLFISTLALAQAQPGMPPFSSWSDEVNLAGLNTILRIPVRTKPGVIPFSYLLTFNNYTTFFGTVQIGGFTEGPSFGGKLNAIHKGGLYCPDGVTLTVEYYNWTFTDALGTVHSFSGIDVDTKGCLTGGSTGSSLADDYTGYYLSVDVSGGGSGKNQLYDKFGNLLGNGTYVGGSIRDPNGNSISTGVPGNGTYVYTDTLGQTALTWAFGNSYFGNGSPEVYSYTDAAGATRKVQVNYSQLTQQTAWGCGWGDLGPIQQYFPTSVSLPDNTSYTFTYESTPPPGNTNNVTGRLASITLPTGAKISYSYSGPNNGMNCNAVVTPVLTRKLTNTDGTVATWTYTYGNTNGYVTTTVVDAMGNETDYSFANSLETQRLVYSGNGSNKSLLLTKVTCYNTRTGLINRFIGISA